MRWINLGRDKQQDALSLGLVAICHYDQTGPTESQIVITFILNRAKNQIRTRFNRQFYLDNLIGTYGILIKRAIKS